MQETFLARKISEVSVAERALTRLEITQDFANPGVTQRWEGGHHLLVIWGKKQLYFDGKRLK